MVGRSRQGAPVADPRGSLWDAAKVEGRPWRALRPAHQLEPLLLLVGRQRNLDRAAQRGTIVVLHRGHDVREQVGVTKTENNTHNPLTDRKSTRLNSSHANISYAVF